MLGDEFPDNINHFWPLLLLVRITHLPSWRVERENHLGEGSKELMFLYNRIFTNKNLTFTLRTETQNLMLDITFRMFLAILETFLWVKSHFWGCILHDRRGGVRLTLSYSFFSTMLCRSFPLGFSVPVFYSCILFCIVSIICCCCCSFVFKFSFSNNSDCFVCDY